MNIVTENIVRYVVLFALQILLLNNLQLWGLCTPCLYVLCLLSLPVSISREVELLIGFATGLLLDVFCNTLGVHTAACGMVAYVRPILIKSLLDNKDRITGTPSSATFTRAVYIRYVILLVLLHHTIVFSLEAFSFHNWWLTLLQIIVSSVVTLALILGLDVLRR